MTPTEPLVTRSEVWDAELIGGHEHRKIVIVEPDPTWPTRFARERQRIAQALRDRALRIDHVGSTSVPGLAAKPIIDIQVSVTDADDEAAYVPALEGAGYVLRVREAARRMLRTPELDVHIHVCNLGSDWERDHLLFRDWLRRSGEDRDRYAEVKRHLATADWPTMDHYSYAKNEVISDITGRADAWASETGWSPASGSTVTP